VKLIKYSLFVTLGLIFTYAITFIASGRSALIKHVYKNSSFFLDFPEQEKLIINYCNNHESIPRELLINPSHYYDYETLPGLSDAQKKELIDLFSKSFKEVVFIQKADEMNLYHGKGEVIEYYVCFDINFFSASFVEEQIGIFNNESGSAFTQLRDTKYVWFFYRWIKIETIDGGMS
jgi:hypothetical protein